MPKRLVVGSIRLARGTIEKVVGINPITREPIKADVADTFMPKVGEVFDFKQEEVDWLNEHAPRSIKHPKNDEEDNASTLVIPASAKNSDGTPVKAEKVSKDEGAADL